MWQLLDGKHFLWDYGSTPLSNLSTIYFSWATYFIGIICLRWYMAEKTRIQKSHSILICYNLVMMIASLCVWHLSTWSLWKTLMHFKKHQPMHCHLTPTDSNQNEGWVFYAMYLCYLLRYFAYMDTVILVLRKKPIPFLHWYQHMFVILLIWSWLQDQNIFGSFAVSAISLVQTFRYFYFFYNGVNLGYKQWIKSLVFLLEIVQFITGIVLTGYQVKICPQSNCVLLSASINVTMVYMVVKYYDSSEKVVATTRDHYKRRNSQKKTKIT